MNTAAQCIGIKALHLRCLIAEIAVVDLAVVGADVDLPRCFRVSHDGRDLFKAQVSALIDLRDLTVLDGKYQTACRLPVDLSRCIRIELQDTFLRKVSILHLMDIQIRVGIADTGSRADHDIAAKIFGENTHGGGRQPVLIGQVGAPGLVDHDNAVVIGADPDTSLTVLVESSRTGQTFRCVQSVKCRAVIADDAAVAADPHFAVACPQKEHRIGCRQSVCRIVDVRGVFHVSDLSGRRIAAAVGIIDHVRVLRQSRDLPHRQYTNEKRQKCSRIPFIMML